MGSWLKRGDVARQERDAEEQRREDAENRVYRFWMPKGKEQRLTFLDGKVGEDGLLSQPVYYEHNLYLNGSWKNWFTCTRDFEPCPLCMAGNNPSMVSPFTVIDHAEWTSKRDGKIHKNELKLFIAKVVTLKKLERKAEKLGGLAGVTFEVFRTDDDRSPAVGDEFEFVEKSGSLSELKAKYGDHMAPLDYEKVIPYLTAAEMRKLGLGVIPVGGESAQDDEPAKKAFAEDDIPF